MLAYIGLCWALLDYVRLVCQVFAEIHDKKNETSPGVLVHRVDRCVPFEFPRKPAISRLEFASSFFCGPSNRITFAVYSATGPRKNPESTGGA